MLRILTTALIGASLLAAQPRPFAPDKMDTILYGAAYYPEYMPTDRLDKDVELMQKAGLTVVRVGESTWSTWEPRDGDFRSVWMKRVLDRLHQAGIKALLGTPTYSIPTWLARKYPDIQVTHNTAIPPLSNPHFPSFPSHVAPGHYGPRQNYDFLNPDFRRHAERIIRQIVSTFKDHPAVIGYQIDNETFPTQTVTHYTKAAFLDRLKRKYETTETINRIWGLVYWGQLVDTWDDFPSREGILNPGYKLEWANFQPDIITEYLSWQAAIVKEYKRPDQFITHDFSGGVHTDIDQWAISRNLDIAANNPYFETQGRFSARSIWMTGDLTRSLKRTNFLITETNAQTIGWDSRAQFPPYPGQFRQAVYSHLAAGANMVEYWHWHSLHYGQETYWRGILSHDLEPNRIYQEMSQVAAELKRIGPQLVNLKKEPQVGILFSADASNALSYMPVGDRVTYQTVMQQMWNALYDLNIEPDFIQAGDNNLARYRVIIVPPLYSASDTVLHQISDYVKEGGHVVMAFKSGFTNQFSTVRDVMAPGPLRAAAGFHYQEFTNLAEPVKLTPDPFTAGAANTADTWAELLIPDTAQVLSKLDDANWKSPVITRNKYGTGTLTYEAAALSDLLQRSVIQDALSRAGILSADQALPPSIRVRHGVTQQGNRLHYYLNFSSKDATFSYPYPAATDLLTSRVAARGAPITIRSWDLAILLER